MRNKDDARLKDGARPQSLRGAKRRSNPEAAAAIVEAFAPGLLRFARNDDAGRTERLAAYVRARALFRSSMNTACAPKRFHSHHGALTRTGLP
jgi:hypothetical protein